MTRGRRARSFMICGLGVLLLIGLVVATPIHAAKSPAKDIRIAVVDIQRVLESTKQGKRAQQTLKKERDSRLGLLEKKKKLLQQKQKEYDEKRLVLTSEALETKRGELEQLTLEIQKLLFETQNEMKKKEGQLLNDILKRIRSVVTKLGVDKKFDLILERNAVEYMKSNSQYDVSQDVIKLYDKTYK